MAARLVLLTMLVSSNLLAQGLPEPENTFRHREQPLPTVERCPAQLQLPLQKLFNGKKTAEYRTGLTSRVHCGGAYISALVIKREPSFRVPGHTLVTIKVSVQVRPGRDLLVTMNFTMVQGQQVLATAEQVLQADEGEINPGDPLSFVLKSEPQPDAPVPDLLVDFVVERR